MEYVQIVISVFFGSVKRAGWTLIGMAVLYFMIFPHDLQRAAYALFYDALVPAFQTAVCGIITAVQPFVQLALLVAILYLAFLAIRRKARGR